MITLTALFLAQLHLEIKLLTTTWIITHQQNNHLKKIWLNNKSLEQNRFLGGRGGAGGFPACVIKNTQLLT